MAANSQFSNPFYFVLIVVGVLFAMTACGYAVLAARGHAGQVSSEADSAAGQQLLVWMDQHGFTALMVELAILAVTTFAAIGTDDYWLRRRRRQGEDQGGGEAPQGSGHGTDRPVSSAGDRQE